MGGKNNYNGTTQLKRGEVMRCAAPVAVQSSSAAVAASAAEDNADVSSASSSTSAAAAGGMDAVLRAERDEREFETWKRQCAELPVKVMQEDALLFDAGDRSPYALLGLETPVFTTRSMQEVGGPLTDGQVEECFGDKRAQWTSDPSDEVLERGIWEILQLMEQDLLVASNPDYERSFFFYEIPTDGSVELGEDGKPLMHTYALVKRAKDLLLSVERRGLYHDLQMASMRAKEWESQITDVLSQINDDAESFPDPMWEGEDPTQWQTNA